MNAWIHSVDMSILYFVQNNLRSDFWTPIWKFITLFGEHGIFWIVLGVALLIPKKTRKVAIVSLCSLAVCWILGDLILKNLVQRVRPYITHPDLVLLVKPEKSYSFPSGHTDSSFASAVVYLKLLPKKYGVPLVVLAALVGLSRIYVAVHYPSDVVAGAILGIACALAACAVAKKTKFVEPIR